MASTAVSQKQTPVIRQRILTYRGHDIHFTLVNRKIRTEGTMLETRTMIAIRAINSQPCGSQTGDRFIPRMAISFQSTMPFELGNMIKTSTMKRSAQCTHDKTPLTTLSRSDNFAKPRNATVRSEHNDPVPPPAWKKADLFSDRRKRQRNVCGSTNALASKKRQTKTKHTTHYRGLLKDSHFFIRKPIIETLVW